MHNETLATLKQRRSIRVFSSRPIAEKTLAAVLDAASYAPSGKGMQPAIVLAVRNEEDRATLSKMNAAILGSETDPYYGAPVILLVLVDSSRPTLVEDGSCLLTYLMVAAASVGLGSCWVHRAKQMFASDEGKALLKKWGVSGEYTGVGAGALGFPEEVPAPAPRKPDFVRFL